MRSTSLTLGSQAWTGKQLFFYVPNRSCQTCDATVQTVKDTLKRMGLGNVAVGVKSCLDNLLPALLQKGLVSAGGRDE